MSNGDEVPFRKVAIQPIDCLVKAKDLLGEQYWLFVGICFVGLFLAGLVPFGILMGPMMCGIYLCMLRRMRGGQVEFETLFKGFDYFLESFIVTMIMVGVLTVLITPLSVIMSVGMIGAVGVDDSTGSPLLFGATMIVFMLGTMVVSFVLGVLFAFTYPLIVDRGYKAIPAIKASFRAGLANFPGMLGLFLLNGVIGSIATLLCFFPSLFVTPICVGAVAVAYRKVFPAAEPAQQ